MLSKPMLRLCLAPRTRLSLAWIGVLCLAVLNGCDAQSEAEELGSLQQAVELARRDAYYDLAFTPAPSLAELRRSYPQAREDVLLRRLGWELAVQAQPYWSNGSITVPAQRTAPVPSTAQVRFSCGATLISPSWALTAGHCVDMGDLQNLRLQLYRPSARLAETYSKATRLSGTWPLFQQERLTKADGYELDEYPCKLVSRCFAGSTPLNCTVGGDVALLRCDGRPGDKYGFVNVNVAPLTGREALLHWKHEVLDPAALSVPSEFDAHYRAYPTPLVYEQNYHYFDNQLLPLRSVAWGLDDPPRFSDEGHVDVHGCHGTSGSGLLVRVGESSEFQLAGPVATGGRTLLGSLCATSPAPNDVNSWRKVDGLGISFPEPNLLLNAHRSELDGDCRSRQAPKADTEGLPFAVGSHRVSTLFSHLDCQLSSFAHGGLPQPDAALGPYPERFADSAPDAEQTISGFVVENGADYRLAVYSSELAPCSANCGAVELNIGNDATVVNNVPAASTTLVTRLFRAGIDGALPIGLRTLTARRALGGLVLLREGQANSFDSPEDRLEAALYPVVLSGGPRPLPMRFTGDGTHGFAALLKDNERMALLRQALAPGQRWTVRMEADSYDGLFCGLLDMRAAPISRRACAPWMQLDDSAGDQGRLGFYVELASTSGGDSAQIRYVAIASSTARDTDDDGVPDVLDNCPGSWNASQGACSEAIPAASPISAFDAGVADSSMRDAHVEVTDAEPARDGAFVQPEAEPDQEPEPEPEPAPAPASEPEADLNAELNQPTAHLETELTRDSVVTGPRQEKRGGIMVSSCATHPGVVNGTSAPLSMVAGLLLTLLTCRRRRRCRFM